MYVAVAGVTKLPYIEQTKERGADGSSLLVNAARHVCRLLVSRCFYESMKAPTGGLRVGVASIASSRDHRNAKNREEKGKLKPVVQDNTSPSLCQKFSRRSMKVRDTFENRNDCLIDHNKNNILYNSHRYTLLYLSITKFYAALTVIDSRYLKALRPNDR